MKHNIVLVLLILYSSLFSMNSSFMPQLTKSVQGLQELKKDFEEYKAAGQEFDQKVKDALSQLEEYYDKQASAHSAVLTSLREFVESNLSKGYWIKNELDVEYYE